MRFSWVVLWLGVAGVGMFLASEWAMSPGQGEDGLFQPKIRWYAPLPLLIWVGAVLGAAFIDLPG